jgi:hypothetical protein
MICWEDRLEIDHVKERDDNIKMDLYGKEL